MKIEKLVLHCTDSYGGTVQSIRRYHVHHRGWSDIGYHYVITNGNPGSGDPDEAGDGGLHPGRSPLRPGAHVRGHNDNSLGIALVGRTDFTRAQLLSALRFTVNTLAVHKLSPDAVFGHYELDPGKTCPNIDMNLFRAALEFAMPYMRLTA